MIVTFYSYKGGVGRSMAIANVGQWLYERGLRVLLVDWDLEAPGLENYFMTAPGDAAEVRQRPGVIDLLRAYQRQFPHLGIHADETGREAALAVLRAQLPDVSHYVTRLRGEPGTGAAGLWLLPAGMRLDDNFSGYAEAVQSFDWEDLYARYRGEALFEWFRQSVDELYDFVLVDSRTGVTEMGGVCTRQLADVVVAFCAPNVSNLEGVMSVVHSFDRDDLKTARDGRPIECLMVPSRIDMNELEQRNQFRDLFTGTTAPLLPDFCRRTGQTFWNLRIPYVPFHAYREALSVGVRHGIEELQDAYAMLSAYLVLLSPADSAARASCAPELARIVPLELMALDGHHASTSEAVTAEWLSMVATRTFEAAAADERPRLLQAALQLVSLDSRSGHLVARHVTEGELGDARGALEPLLRAGVVQELGGEHDTRVFRFSDRFDPARWEPLTQWLADPKNTRALLWRDRLATLAEGWSGGGRSTQALIGGEMLAEALDAREHWPCELQPVEREYLDASVAAATSAARRRAWSWRLAVSAAVVLGVFGLGWFAYTRTDAYQMVHRLPETGNRLAGAASSKTVREWARALVMAGEYDALGEVAEGVRDGAERAALFAESARAAAVVGATAQAGTYADQALRLARDANASGSLMMQLAIEFEDIPTLRAAAVTAAEEAIARMGSPKGEELPSRLDRVRALQIAGRLDEAGKWLDEALAPVLALPEQSTRLRGLVDIARLAASLGTTVEVPANIRVAPGSLPADPLRDAEGWALMSELMRSLGRTGEAEAASAEALGILMAIPSQMAQGEEVLYVATAARRLTGNGPSLRAARWAIAQARRMAVGEDDAGATLAPGQQAARQKRRRIQAETLGQAAEVLAAHGHVDEALSAVALIAGADERVVYFASLADQMDGRGQLEGAIKAALRARDDARAVRDDARRLSMVRAAEALARVNHTSDVRALLGELEPVVTMATVSTAIAQPAPPTTLTARMAKVWARIGDFQQARRLLDTLPQNERLSGASTMLFEYWRRRDPGRARSLEEMKSSA